jgi:hypothetical protein
VEFAHFIRDKKSENPIRILSVVDEEGDAESKLVKARQNLSKMVQGLSLPATRLETLVVADQNVPAGINRISRDLDVQTIILGWPMKETFTDLIFGHKTDHILETSERCIIVCRLVNPLVTYKRIVLYCPPYRNWNKGLNTRSKRLFCLAMN